MKNVFFFFLVIFVHTYAWSVDKRLFFRQKKNFEPFLPNFEQIRANSSRYARLHPVITDYTRYVQQKKTNIICHVRS
jgi:endonuclease III-like uncharacterized protein